MRFNTKKLIKLIKDKPFIRFRNRYGAVTIQATGLAEVLTTAAEVTVYIRKRCVQFLFPDPETEIILPGLPDSVKSCVTIPLKRGNDG